MDQFEYHVSQFLRLQSKERLCIREFLYETWHSLKASMTHFPWPLNFRGRVPSQHCSDRAIFRFETDGAADSAECQG